MTHVCLVTYRVMVEQRERHRVKSIFSKVVAPDVVNELLKAEKVALGGARRKVTVFFADVRGFTRVTDEIQARADEHVRTQHLPTAQAEAYLDEQARDILATVNLYLGVIADTVKKHNGTLDKYIGDCVMAFWGAPAPNEMQAADCVRAAIDAQRAIYRLNVQRAAENKRREKDNEARVSAGQSALPFLTLLALGTGINTGTVTVGLMGSDAHIVNYTVFGREVNLASRLEGVSGRGRIIVSDSTFRELRGTAPELAAMCVELPAQPVKGFREAVQIHEVRWREAEAGARHYDTGILTGRELTLPTDFVPPEDL
jgi:adenylate cyclase